VLLIIIGGDRPEGAFDFLGDRLIGAGDGLVREERVDEMYAEDIGLGESAQPALRDDAGDRSLEHREPVGAAQIRRCVR
jgi:hypothetical protein